ncbi:cell wall hydrolase, partial [Erythrobacter sp. WG]|uniref:cell wall hydrolase n=1 Tax=Erythrobacter sp. WG TaxID=2985510 RepID=UPI002B4BF24A
ARGRRAWLGGGAGRKRLAVLLAAITVPAMAANDLAGRGLTTLPGNAVESTAALATRQAAEAALSFERPGMSFPGSAYFYMADPAGSALVALPTDNPLATGAESGRQLGALIDVGVAARPFFGPASGISQFRAQECLAQAVWYEAASESEAGQRAVAQVVLNRVANPAWPSSVCGVVYQGSERSTGCQFTFTCDGSLARRPGGASWARAQRIAAEALAGSVYAPVGLATHYHTLWVDPYWASSLDHIGTIGAHRFYRSRGAMGAASAFAGRYAGFEPAVSGRTAPPPAIAAPAAVAQARPAIAYELGPVPLARQAPRGSGKPAASVPVEAPREPFTEVGTVKPEYARAGQWKAQPGAAPALSGRD